MMAEKNKPEAEVESGHQQSQRKTPKYLNIIHIEAASKREAGESWRGI